MSKSNSYPVVPTVVGLETVNYCNARCPFCPLFQGDDMMDRKIRPSTTMSMELFDNLVTQIAGWPAHPGVIFLNMDGEPLLDRLFEQRLQTFHRKGLSRIVDIQTNAEYLDDKKINAILDNKIMAVTVGFDGATKEVYESHRVKCHYEVVLDNLKRLIHQRDNRDAKTRIVIKYVVTPRNKHELHQAYAMFSEILNPQKDVMYASVSLNWGSSKLEQIGFVLEKLENVVNEPVSGCELFENQMIILADGRLASCCFDYNLQVNGGAIGDAKTTPLLDIWNSDTRQRLRQKLATKVLTEKPAKCQQCTFSFSRKPPVPGDFGFTETNNIDTTRFGLNLNFE